MTFNRFMIKTVLANYRKYAAYFLCIAFSMTVVFLFVSIWHSPGFTEQTSGGMRQIVRIGGVISGVFSIFLITYAYHHFLKNRVREIGILLSYGLLYRDLRKLIITENSLIFGGALLISAAGGSVFARLFFMVTTAILGLEDIRFSLTAYSFVLTAVCFAPIYIAIVILTLVKMKESTVSAMIANNRLGEMKRNGSTTVSLSGLTLVISSLAFLYLYTRDPMHTASMQKAILAGFVCCIVGTGLWMSQFMGLLIAFRKRKESYYYRKILNLSEFAYRFAQNRSVMLMVCLLSIGIVFFSTLSYSLYNQSYEAAEKEQMFDAVFKDYDVLRLSEGVDLKGFKTQSGDGVKEIRKLDIVYIDAKNLQHAPWRTNKQVIVASAETASLVLPSSVAVSEGTVRLLDFSGARSRGASFSYFPDQVSLALGNQAFTYRLAGTDTVKLFDRYMFPQPVLLLLHDKDFQTVKQAAAQEERGAVFMIDFANWQESGELVKRLKDQIDDLLAASDNRAVSSVAERYPEPFSVFSKYDRFVHTKQVGGFALFILLFISLLFFATACVVLYFKVFSDLEEDRRKIKLLHTIGVTSREAKTYLDTKLKMVIALPVAVGSLIGLILCVSINLSLAIEMEIANTTILLNALKVLLIFLVSISLYYAGLKSAYRNAAILTAEAAGS